MICGLDRGRTQKGPMAELIARGEALEEAGDALAVSICAGFSRANIRDVGPSVTVTVDMTQLSGPLTARWYDPAGGSFTTIAGSPFANAGSTNFTTPGNNADGPGNQDWVLVLEVLRASTANPDFDGDAKADLGVYRASTGQWFVLRRSG